MKARNITTYRWASAAIIAAMVILSGEQVRADVVLIDFGSTETVTGGTTTYNQVNEAKMLAGTTLALMNTAGGATGWDFRMGNNPNKIPAATKVFEQGSVTSAPASISDNYDSAAWGDYLGIGNADSGARFFNLNLQGLDTNKTYNVTVYGARLDTEGPQTFKVNAGTGGNSATEYTYSSTNTSIVVSYTDITPTVGGLIRIQQFRDAGGRTALNFMAVESIPEPASIGLILGGAGALLYIRRIFGMG
jgi:hypothetical protein